MPRHSDELREAIEMLIRIPLGTSCAAFAITALRESLFRGVLLAGVLLGFVGARAWAHHAFAAEFDIEKPITLEGTVREWEMINPHSWFHIDVEGEDGEVVTWMIEGGSPNQLIRMGVTKNSVPAGTRLTVQGYLARDGTNKAVGRDFTLADGSRLFLGGSAPGADGR